VPPLVTGLVSLFSWLLALLLTYIWCDWHCWVNVIVISKAHATWLITRKKNEINTTASTPRLSLSQFETFVELNALSWMLALLSFILLDIAIIHLFTYIFVDLWSDFVVLWHTVCVSSYRICHDQKSLTTFSSFTHHNCFYACEAANTKPVSTAMSSFVTTSCNDKGLAFFAEYETWYITALRWYD